MAHPRTSRRRASALSSASFFIGLAIIALTDAWWPWLMLVIGTPIALRQFLLGHIYDMWITLIIFYGAFIASFFSIAWNILLPILLIMSAVYILVREFQLSKEHPEDEEEEDVNHEIEEEEAEEAKK